MYRRSQLHAPSRGEIGSPRANNILVCMKEVASSLRGEMNVEMFVRAREDEVITSLWIFSRGQMRARPPDRQRPQMTPTITRYLFS